MRKRVMGILYTARGCLVVMGANNEGSPYTWKQVHSDTTGALLPPSRGEPEEYLHFFWESRERRLRIAIELRGWSGQWIEKLCQDFDLVNVVDLNRRDPVWLGSGGILYVRFHGRYDDRGRIFAHYSYMPDELEIMAGRVKSYAPYAMEAWINFNNSDVFRNAQMSKIL